nr:MAG TPA: hypothetical protein [Caudoviricetes sp.]DAM45035.1 MAG TPA: hypothetical protein [Caudoviricetes sp.]DAU65215.1 MAG TPA: hypothetical protein [Caudoviricetes sp.]
MFLKAFSLNSGDAFLFHKIKLDCCLLIKIIFLYLQKYLLQ